MLFWVLGWRQLRLGIIYLTYLLQLTTMIRWTIFQLVMETCWIGLKLSCNSIIDNKKKLSRTKRCFARGLLQITYSKLIGIDGRDCYFAGLLRFNKEMLMNWMKRGIFQGSRKTWTSALFCKYFCGQLFRIAIYFILMWAKSVDWNSESTELNFVISIFLRRKKEVAWWIL